MQVFQNLSIRHKLTIITMLSSCVALMLAGLAYVAWDQRITREAMESDIQVLTDIFDENVAPGLVFNDPQLIEDTLKSLAGHPSILGAAVYDKRGRNVARYERADQHNSLAWPPIRETGAYFGKDRLEAFRTIVLSGEPEGTIYIASDLEELRARFWRNLAVTAVVFVLSSLAALALSSRLQRVIAEPILRLAGVVRTVAANQDYSVRASKKGHDELGVLIDGFNGMLAEIQRRDADLRAANQHLEMRVQERTHELEQEIGVRRNTETELAKARDAALESARLKSQFLANMSHEIRTPMNGVIGMTGLLLETELSPEQRNFAQTVRDCGDALLRLINDILDFSKLESDRITIETLDFDLENVLEGTLDILAEQTQHKRLELISFSEPDVPTQLRGDPGRLRQVLINLIGNALKFTHRGEVAVYLTCPHQTETEARIRVSVSDTGIGIAEDAQPRLFQVFTQADGSTTRHFGGTGLGLAISKKLVDLMNGTIGVKSTLGKGSTFWFEIPFAKQPNPAQPLPPLPDVLAGRNILIVDDNETNRQILERHAASWGMSHASAPGARRALDLLRRQAATQDPFVAVILDMQMPEMDGVQLAKAIRADARISGVRLLMLSSLGGPDSATLRAGGIDLVLPKPAKKSQLRRSLVELLIGCDSATQNDRSGAVPTSPQAAAPSSPSVPARKARVLVAEDNPVNQQLAVLLLKKFGYTADAVGNGREVLEALERIPYDLVLMDCQMPEMDGYQTAAEIRRRFGTSRQIPIIALTAHALTGDREKCLAAGMSDYLSKPIQAAELQAALAWWLPDGAQQDNSRTPAATDANPPGAAAADAAEVPTLDAVVLQRIKELAQEADATFLPRFVEAFTSGAGQRLTGLRDAAKQRDALQIAQEAHALNGTCLNVGAKRMAKICRELCERSSSPQWQNVEELLTQLEEEFPRVREKIEAGLRA